MILVVDNYDSFTYNLVHYLNELGAETVVHRNDAISVCLGHQAIGQAFGGEDVRARALMHGKTSLIHHTDTGVFKGLKNPFTATRYHSLSVEKDVLPQVLEVTARTEDGEIMGVQHKARPIHGVQFHPESIATECGHELLGNFLDLAGVKRLAQI